MNKKFNKVLPILLISLAVGQFVKNQSNIKSIDGFSHVQAVSSVKSDNFSNFCTTAKGSCLIECSSGSLLYEKDAQKRLPIASMCKMMTLLVCFDEIRAGNLTLEENIKVSEKAASMGGSQVFLEANCEYKVKDLIKSIIVCSANDSCVAMAERICGSESDFVDKMNEKAAEIGANNTLFANCTGLPKEPQYSCASDVAKMLNELIKNEEYLTFSKIWMEDFNHPTGRITGMTNTNRLIRYYDGCDAGKTGFTSEAGFCLAATAKRGEMRVISVVIGEDTSDHRFSDVKKMFDYAFDNYTVKAVVDENAPLNEEITVVAGKKKRLSIKAERPVYLFSKKGEKDNITFETTLLKSVKAPIEEGDNVGELTVYKDGVEIDKVSIVSAERIERASLWDRYNDTMDKWNF